MNPYTSAAKNPLYFSLLYPFLSNVYLCLFIIYDDASRKQQRLFCYYKARQTTGSVTIEINVVTNIKPVA